MTSSRDPNPYPDLVTDTDHTGASILTDLEAIHDVPVPALAFDAATRRAPARAPLIRHWRPLMAGAVAAALVAAAVLLPPTWGSETEKVSAQEILANARAAAESPAGYHRTYRHTYLGGPNPNVPHQVQVVETWYRDPGHHRTEIRDASGNLIAGLILNGDEGWNYYWDGILRIIHFGPNSTFVQALREGLSPYQSLEALLEQLGGSCETPPAVAGESAVVGRPVHIVENCGHRLWIDKESFFVLESRQVSQASASPVPTVPGESNVDLNDFITESTGFEWNIESPDSVFDYQPPPGTFVVEQDF